METNGLHSSGAATPNFYTYQIQRSVRIDKGDQSYLQYPTGMFLLTTQNIHFSFWVKRSQLNL